MKNLPTELLSHVFALTITRDSYLDQYPQESSNKPQATLSLVCRYWEQVAITTPQIWSYIHLYEEKTEDALRRRLDLARSEPLDIRVDLGDDVDSYETFRDCYIILLDSIDRWRSFVVQGTVSFNEDLQNWIPGLLPSIVEGAYYVDIENHSEGLAAFDYDAGEDVVFRFKPWTVAPNLRRFAVKTSGQFYFKECPLVTEFVISGMGHWWGGSLDEHSWHDKWEEYLTQLTERCPQLETLEISDWWDYVEGSDPMGWTQAHTKWPLFSHLRTLKADALGAACGIPILSKFNAPDLQNLQLGHIHVCLPVPLPSVTLSIDPSSCRIRFDKSPLHAIKLFLERASQVKELNVSIDLADALEIGAERYGFVDERGDDPAGLRGRVTEDWAWIKENIRSVEWVLPETFEGLFLQEELTAESAAEFAMIGKIQRPERQMA
ncbi:hypothetical protein FRC04_002107 [Tulasnella sp. 424]|nr:hypothetical protein FRC04_002107 [Tulasnella sp. 424]KAG8967979.1 hypothetical protein FRC05_001689 [Tulasnella sp. 425]